MAPVFSVMSYFGSVGTISSPLTSTCKFRLKTLLIVEILYINTVFKMLLNMVLK